MTPDVILCERLVKEYTDKPLALVAADAIQEYRECDRLTALKLVAKIRRTARNVAEVTKAVSLLHTHSPRRRILVNAMLASLGFIGGSACTVYIVTGSRPPSIGVPLDDTGPIVGTGPAITVGARWTICTNRRLRADAQAVRDRERGITRFKKPR